jgi:hypothetical protein
MIFLSAIPLSLAIVVTAGTVHAVPEELTPTPSPTTMSHDPVGSDLPFWFTGTSIPEPDGSDSCDDTHQYVVWKLGKTFVKKNCVDDGKFQITCFNEVPGWNKAWAYYDYDEVDYGVKGSPKFKPSSLQLIDEGRAGSHLEHIDFSNVNSCTDSLKVAFKNIEYRRENPDESPYCLDTHTDVVKRLKKVFGRKKCKEDCDAINCSVEVPGWFTATANYSYSSTFRPSSLQVIDTYTYDGGGSLSQSMSFYAGTCLDTLDAQLDGIKTRRKNPDQAPVGACQNTAVPFPYNNGKKETSCNTLAALRLKSIRKKCNRHTGIATNCPGLCKTDECPCANNPVTFALAPNGKTFSCDMLIDMNEKKKEKKCRKESILGNCPAFCDERCLIG